MFVFIATLTIIGFIAGFIIGRQYTEREVKVVEAAKEDKKED